MRVIIENILWGIKVGLVSLVILILILIKELRGNVKGIEIRKSFYNRKIIA